MSIAFMMDLIIHFECPISILKGFQLKDTYLNFLVRIISKPSALFMARLQILNSCICLFFLPPRPEIVPINTDTFQVAL